MTKKEFQKINKELNKLVQLMEAYEKKHGIPADGREINIDNNRSYYYWNISNVPSFYLPKCCQGCSNNPINNPYSNGVCCCSLPSQEMFRW